MSKNELTTQEKQQELEFQDLQVKMNEMIAQQQSTLNRSLLEIRHEQDKQKEEILTMQKEHEGARDLEIKRHRVTENRYGYVSLSDLGQSYQVSIGSKTMGKLLRVVGLAKKKISRTEPLRSATLNNYSKSMMYGEYPTYQWNPEKCIEKIDRWLESNNIIDEFYSIEDESELMEYINELHDLYTD